MVEMQRADVGSRDVAELNGVRNGLDAWIGGGEGGRGHGALRDGGERRRRRQSAARGRGGSWEGRPVAGTGRGCNATAGRGAMGASTSVPSI